MVEADPGVQTRWPDLAARVRTAFGGRDDIDTCSRVRLGLRGPSIEVTVTLPDGRSASRVLERPEDVEPTLAALLLLPERSAPAKEPEPERASSAPAATPVSAAPPEPRASVAPAPRVMRSPAAASPATDTPQPDPSGVGVEFSLITGARAGDGMVSAGLGVQSLLDLSSFLIALEGRLERYSGTGVAELDPALAVSLLGGYRIHFGTTALDLAAGPGLTMVTAETTEAIALMDSQSRTERWSSSDPVVPRLAIAAHYRFAMHSWLRTFVGLDGQFGPARETSALSPSGGSRLPAWAVGLVLGATVGTR